MPVLTSHQRKLLEDACTKGRRASEQAVRAALTSLAITNERPPSHLNDGDRQLRRGLRAKARQLGDNSEDLRLLVTECAYEQWHRLLFARFLAENNLLIHPEYRAPVTVDDCEELADSLGEPDGWSVAARFASEILPGIFRVEDPCVQLRLPPEGRLALEGILAALPSSVFAAADSLGWVYQYWQKDRKDEVNASEVRIGGADIGPVTQLFTENYMVRFLLDNSLGAWWAARHPNSPLTDEFGYLRRAADGSIAAGKFDVWPSTVAEVTVMDPCCGSGHFLVEAFSMLWPMRAEEEGLSPIAAQDAVLRDNLFGLELDPRCVQIAMLALALHAWKAGGGWRELPVPNIACSGIPVKAGVNEWKELAAGDDRMEQALVRLHILFRHAETLGSLINPKRTSEIADGSGLQRSFDEVDWEDVAPILQKAQQGERDDPAAMVLGADASGIARAADLLSRKYTLLVTNVPYLGLQTADPVLVSYCEARYPNAAYDLATVFLERCREMSQGSIAAVTQLNWSFLARFSTFRRSWLAETSTHAFCILGPGAFSAISGEVVQALLTISSASGDASDVFALDLRSDRGLKAKEEALRSKALVHLSQTAFRSRPDTLLSLGASDVSPLSEFADSWQGLVTGDRARFVLSFWEVAAESSTWARLVTAPGSTADFCGRESLLRWESGTGSLIRDSSAHNFNPPSVVGTPGVLVSEGSLSATLYQGEFFNQASVPLIPHNSSDLAALWCFASSPSFAEEVRKINNKIIVGAGYMIKVPFDAPHWRAVAAQRFPDGLPAPSSADPTQWLFDGRPSGSTAPLQVAVARLVGYRWPEQLESDSLDSLADADGIVCLPSVAGESAATERLQQMLSVAFGQAWSQAKQKELLQRTGSKKNLSDWLRDDFFKQHCVLFGHRPFIWHVWDGLRDGFAALVNYHQLDRKTLEKLTYTYLGDWIERQRAEARDDRPGAEARLAAASKLRRSLELILDGEPPYDIYVRWKPLSEQPIGWNPDMNDGVRVNVRPFVEAGVLRSSFNVHWRKDRGTNPDGSERLNDVHCTAAEKRAAKGAPT
ncbi:MAG: DNA methyltransferase [Microthrixaceae bacterium]